MSSNNAPEKKELKKILDLFASQLIQGAIYEYERIPLDSLFDPSRSLPQINNIIELSQFLTRRLAPNIDMTKTAELATKIIIQHFSIEYFLGCVLIINVKRKADSKTSLDHLQVSFLMHQIYSAFLRYIAPVLSNEKDQGDV